MWDDRDDKRRSDGKSRGLPLYAGGAGNAGSVRGLAGRGRSGRLKWLAMAFAAAALIWWTTRNSSESSPDPAPTATRNPLKLKERPPSRPPPPVELRPPEHEVKRPAAPAKKPAHESRPLRVVDIDVRAQHQSQANAALPPTNRFLAYSPHSGYHNQRISLENAMTLAFMLDRTLLVPPVWLGHAIPYISFDKLGRRLAMASKDGLDRCKDYGDGGSEDPIPRECEGYCSWTQVSWEFLVDLSDARQVLPMQDRWNQSEEWLQEELGLRRGKPKGGEKRDVFHLKDDVMYQYRFYDSPDDDEPLAKFENRLDVGKLAKDTKDYKLLHVGSMFGTSRMRVQQEDNFDARSIFRRSMIFKNDLLDGITTTIRDRLGGSGNYYGLHLRVGDGIFQKDAAKNMAGVWTSLCVNKMKMAEGLCASLAAAAEATSDRKLKPRQLVQSTPTASAASPLALTTETVSLIKRANSRPQRDGAYNHAPLPRLATIRTRADSPLAESLTCRGELHTDEDLLPFNQPLFIATDSKIPTADRHLAIFFKMFPCTFVLGDFASTSPVNSELVDQIAELNGLRNQEDKVPLAQFLYPQLDAQIAAWGRGLLGTPQSTYSRFAIDVLHQMYQ